MQDKCAFTLMEMLVTLTMVSIMTALTVTGMSAFLQQQKNQSVLNTVTRVLEYARDQADILRKPVTVDQDGDWQTIVTFVDVARKGRRDARTEMLTQDHIKLYGGSLHMQSFPASRHFISLMPNQDDRSDNAAIWYCAQNKDSPAWAVVVNQQSVIHQKFPNRRGNIRDQQGRVLRC